MTGSCARSHATDSLCHTQMLRAQSGWQFVDLRAGAASLPFRSLDGREYGPDYARRWLFPVDAESVNYLRATGSPPGMRASKTISRAKMFACGQGRNRLQLDLELDRLSPTKLAGPSGRRIGESPTGQRFAGSAGETIRMADTENKWRFMKTAFHQFDETRQIRAKCSRKRDMASSHETREQSRNGGEPADSRFGLQK